MKTLSSQEEQQILYECLVRNKKEIVFQQYSNLVFLIVHKTLVMKNASHSPEDIEDLHNEVFLQLFEKDCLRLRQYKKDKGFTLAKWIMLITNRIVLNHIRDKGFNGPKSINARIPIEEILHLEEEGSEEEYNYEACLALVKQAMKKLQARDRLILKLHYSYELSLQEVASRLNMKIGAVYTAKSRAVNRLRSLIKSEDDLFI